MQSLWSLALLAALPGGTALAQPSMGEQIAAAADIGASVQAVGADSLTSITASYPGGVTGLPDQSYQTLPGYRPMKLDLFLPPQSFAGPRPLVVYVHGGGWMAGGPRRSAAYTDWPRVLASLAAKGYVVASVGYRFAREAPFPAAAQDVKAALRWLRANAGTYRIDPVRGAIWGQSAGGHLASLVGLSCGAAALEPEGRIVPKAGNVETTASTVEGADTASDCVQAVVSWFGIYDFQTLLAARGNADSAAQAFLACDGKDCAPDRVKAASPVSYIDRKDPPVLLMHGDRDETVPLSQHREMTAALKAGGVSVREKILPGVGHSWVGATAEATQAASREALRETIDFIEARIGDGGAR